MSVPPNNKVIYFKVMAGGTHKIMPRAVGALESSVFLKAKKENQHTDVQEPRG